MSESGLSAALSRLEAVKDMMAVRGSSVTRTKRTGSASSPSRGCEAAAEEEGAKAPRPTRTAALTRAPARDRARGSASA